MNQEKSTPPIIKDDEIDLMALVMTIWLGRKTIFKIIGLFLVLGLFIALFSSKEYTTTVKLMPESGQGSSLGALGGLASQFGFGGMSASPDGENIPSEYYPAIVASLPFMKDLMDYQVMIPEAGEKMTLFYYFSEYRGTAILSSIKKYTIGLPFTILAALKGEKEVAAVVEGMRPTIRLSEEEWEVYEHLIEKISVSIDKETGIVSLTVKMPEDYLVADVADRVTEMLVEYVKDYKTEKTRNDLEFIEAQMNDSEKRFEKAQESLAKFRDQSHGRMTEMARTTEQRLQSDYDLAFKIYSAMAQKFDETRIKLQEQTPVVKVLEPAVVPKEKSAPRRSIIMIVTLFLGGFVGIGVLFGRMIWGNFRTQFQKMKEEGN